jgi:GTPase SAR1 family protein
MQSLKNLGFHRRDPLPRISIIGLYDSGKTTILHKLASSEVKITVPTIALNIEQADITIKTPTTDGKVLDFTTWVTDLGGASKLHPIIQMCMVGRPGTVPWVSGIVWVIDATDQVRFPESHEELRKLLPKLGENQEIAPSVPVLM